MTTEAARRWLRNYNGSIDATAIQLAFDAGQRQGLVDLADDYAFSPILGGGIRTAIAAGIRDRVGDMEERERARIHKPSSSGSAS